MGNNCGYNSLNSYLFGAQRFIKFQGNDIIGVEGSNITERLIAGDLRMPYKQLMKGRVVLQPGQCNYLLNFLGMGDNATFLAIIARYDRNSIFETDNYVQWYFFDSPNAINSFAQVLVLTGNSTNRIPQLYLNNPNAQYPVTLDIMVANIDDTYNFFNNISMQSGYSYNGLTYMSVITQQVNVSLAIISSDGTSPLTYIALNGILSMELRDTLVIINDSTMGNIYLDFLTPLDAYRANGLINWVLDSPGRVIQDLDPRYFLDQPVILFTSNVYLIGSTATPPFYSYQGNPEEPGASFSATMLLSNFNGNITQPDILTYSVTTATCSQGTIVPAATQQVVIKQGSNVYSGINTYGNYTVSFNYTSSGFDILNPYSEILLSVYTEIPVILFATNSVFIPGGSLYSPPYNSTQATTFSATMSLGSYGGTISYTNIINDTIIAVTYSGGTISLTSSQIAVTLSGITYSYITQSATYSMAFELTNSIPGILTPNNVVLLQITP